MSKFLDKRKTVLDLASGTGLLINKIHNQVAHITAVEPFKEFSQYIIPASNIEIINTTVQNLELTRTFDIITLFELVHYLGYVDANRLYAKCSQWLNPGGMIIIKSHFGIKEDVTVSSWSEELKSDYYSEYRAVDHELVLLKANGICNISVVDIYPPEGNRWTTTHNYALTGYRM